MKKYVLIEQKIIYNHMIHDKIKTEFSLKTWNSFNLHSFSSVEFVVVSEKKRVKILISSAKMRQQIAHH